MSLTTTRRVEPLQQGQQRARRVGGVAAVVGVGLRRREGAVFLGGGEAESGALDRDAALLPGLDRHLVPATGKCPSERDRREDVPGIAEGGDEDSHSLRGAGRSPGRVKTISGMWQLGDTFSRKRTASPTSLGRIISSAGTALLDELGHVGVDEAGGERRAGDPLAADLALGRTG